MSIGDFLFGIVSGGSVASSGDTVSSGSVISGSSVGTDAVGSFTLTTGGIIWICLAIFFIIMIALEFLRSRYVLSVTRKNITLENLPEGFDGTKLAVISDLHQMRFGEYNEELAKHIRREEPDYIMFAGDMGDADKFDVDAFYDFLDSLGNDIPLMLVPGNHDLRIGGGTLHKNFVRELDHAGALLLNNGRAEMVSGESKMYVYGFCPPLEKDEDIPQNRRKLCRATAQELCEKLGERPKDAPTILLAHDPEPFEEYKEWGADLVLCGHMHGGGVRLPFLGGLFSPNGGMLPKYSAGIYELDDCRMFVTRGLGSPKGLNLRFFNAPEIGLITLLRPDSQLQTDVDALRIEIGSPSELWDKAKGQGKSILEWMRSELRSLKDLLNERLNQLSDFFSLMFGKKRSRFARQADEKKKNNTYVAPKANTKKHIPDRTRKPENDNKFGEWISQQPKMGRVRDMVPDNSKGRSNGQKSGKNGQKGKGYSFKTDNTRRYNNNNSHDSFGTSYDNRSSRTGDDE